MDLSRFTDDDLRALSAGDVTKLSDDALRMLSGEMQSKPLDVPVGVASAMNIAQAPTFGFADELYGGAQWLRGKDYEAAKKEYQATVEKFKEDYPKSATLGTVAGNIATGLGMTKALQAIPAVPQFLKAPETTKGMLGQAATLGAMSGAAQGAGEAESDVGKMAMIGAAGGAVMGPAIGGAAAGIGAAGGNIMARVAPKYANRIAASQVARALIRDERAARGGLQNMTDLEVLDDAILRASGRMNKLGEKAVLAEAGAKSSEATRELLDTMATADAYTKGRVVGVQHARQAALGDDMRRAAQDTLSPGGQRLHEYVDDLVADRAAAAGPLYEQLHQMVVANSPNMERMLSSLKELGAFRAAKKMASARVGADPMSGDFTLDPAQQMLSVRDLDRAKQGLDQLIARSMGNRGESTPMTRELIGLKKAFTDEIDALTIDPQTQQSLYKQARETFAGYSSMKNAAEEGRRAMTMDDAMIREITEGMSASEIDAFRVGALESLRSKMGLEGGRTEILNMWKNQNTAEKLREIFGDEKSFRRFAAAMAKERHMKALQGVGHGSQTAQRLSRIGEAESDVLGDAISLGMDVKSMTPGMFTSANRLWRKVAIPENVRNATGDILLSRPSAAEMVTMREIANDLARRRAMIGGISGASVPVNALIR